MRISKVSLLSRLLLPSVLALSACSAAEGSGQPGASEAETGAAKATHPSRVDKPFVLPYDVERLSEDEQASFLESISDAEFATLVDNARIAAFLRENVDSTTLETLNSMLPEVGIFTVDNVTRFLSPDQLARLSSFEIDLAKQAGEKFDSSTVEKGCGSFSFKGYSTSCNAFFGFCTTCEIWRRKCDWWDLSYREDSRNCQKYYYL